MRISYGRMRGFGYNARTGNNVAICPGGLKKKKYNNNNTTESDSVVCITLGSHENKVSEETLQCASNSRVRLCGVHPCAESSLAMCIKPQFEILLLLFLCDALRYYYDNSTVSHKLF